MEGSNMIMRKQQSLTLPRVSLFALAVIMAPGSSAATDTEQTQVFNSAQQRDVEADLSALTYEVYQRSQKLEGQRLITRPTVTLDQQRNVVLVDLGRGAVPKEYTPSLEEQLHLINNNILIAFQDRSVMPEVEFLFGGRDIFHYFPEERPSE
jgi:hypothetical protein